MTTKTLTEWASYVEMIKWWEHVIDACVRVEFKVMLTHKYYGTEKDYSRLTNDEIQTIWFNEVVLKWYNSVENINSPYKLNQEQIIQEYLFNFNHNSPTGSPDSISPKAIKSFKITWDGTQYKVTIPNYDGGEVVPIEQYKLLVESHQMLLENLKTALNYMDVFMIRDEEPLVGENLKTDLFNVRQAITNARKINI